MSTTPSISDIPYTIVGGTRVQQSGTNVRGLAALVLDRGSRTLRADSLEQIAGAGVDEALCVVGPSPHYDVEQLAGKLPNVRFLLLSAAVSTGEQINIGMHESSAKLVLVTWSDFDIGVITDRALERVRESDSLCAVPTIRSERGTVVPTVTAPAFFGPRFRTIPAQPGNQGETLYPFDYTGVYDRERFLRSGGFDRAIRNPYWQLLDFGLRAYLWGERIVVAPSLRVDATRAIPAADTTLDESYARFYLKNLAIRFGGDSGRLPARRILGLMSKSGLGPVAAVRLFREIRSWVKRNRYRFRQDSRRVTELWEAVP